MFFFWELDFVHFGYANARLLYNLRGLSGQSIQMLRYIPSWS